ncbi:MAG: ankyrin repeat domain-containing protein [Acidobacteriota bacterium]
MAGARILGWCLAVSFAAAGAVAAPTDVRLASAMKNRDKASVRSLLAQRIDVNIPDVEGMTALHWAAHWDDLDTAQQLLRAGANAKATNRYGVTPLHEAATLGSAAMIETLLKAGADANAVYGEGETPLMAAARTGSVDAVKMLLTFGAAVNARETFRGQTALMYAVAENHANVVKLLIELKADVNARSIHYEFPKLTGGNGGIIHDRPEGGLTPIFFAARQGAVETADLLIAAGADLKAAEPQYGFTPMQTAIFNGHYDLAARLVDKGADVNDGSLYTAVEMRNLARYSNRPNPPDADKELTSLDLIKVLLAHGADPNRVYTKKIPPRQAQGDIVVTPGATPLYRAMKATDLTVARLLLDKGANPSAAIKDGSTPLMMASGMGARRIATDEDVIEKTGTADPLDAVKMFVEAGADLDVQNDLGNTALHYAAQTGATRIVEYLVARGARLDVYNYAGQAPVDLTRSQPIKKLMESRTQ